MPRPDLSKLQPAQPSRSSSMSSDISPSVISSPNGPAVSIPDVRPPPAYVAVSAASQLVTDAHSFARESCEDLPHEPPTQEDAIFSESALAQINGFLDHLLYRFLSTSRSASFKSLRSAVEQVLKGRLGRLAVAAADAELAELLAEGEDEELASEEEDGGDAAKWDTDIFFHRTRLRIMVYMRLGEMEDEDEEDHLAELGENDDSDDETHDQGLVSWAGAIFLTSILELVAEECLKIAGQAAFKRLQFRRPSLATSPGSPGSTAPRVMIVDSDVDKAGIDSRLGRLWRSWKHKLRTPLHDHSRNASSVRSSVYSRKASVSTMQSDVYFARQSTSELPPAEEEVAEQDIEAEIVPEPRTVEENEATDEEQRRHAMRMWRLSKRPSSLVMPSDTKRWDYRAWVALDVERQPKRRSRPITLPGPGSKEYEEAREMGLLFNQHAGTTDTADGVFAGPQASDLLAEDDVSKNTTSHDVEDVTTELTPGGESVEKDISKSKYTAKVRDEVSSDSDYDSHEDELPIDRSTKSTTDVIPTIIHEASNGTNSATSTNNAQTLPKTSLPDLVRDRTHETTTPSSKRSAEIIVPDGESMHPLQSQPKMHTAPTTPLTPSSATAPTPFIPAFARYAEQRSAGSTTPPEISSDRSWFRRMSHGSKPSKSTSINESRKTSQETNGGWNESKERELQAELAGKHFSSYIASKETIKYTLTPKQLQKIETDLPRPDDDHEPRKNASNENVIYSSAKVVSPVRNHVHSPHSDQSRSTSMTSRLGAAATRPSVTNVKPMKRGFIPREARVVTDSMRDFADYIRMTGPAPKAVIAARRPNTAVRSIPRVDLSRKSSVELDRPPVPAAPSDEDIGPLLTITTKTSTGTLQPRDARSTRQPNSELIDFLRSGPQGAQVSRHVVASPSDENARSIDRIQTQRTNSLMSRSAQNSVNSYNPLLRQPLLEDHIPEHQETAPPSGKRQYRNKDPYALPSDDEDEDLMPIHATKRNDESFVDFLRNVEPPKPALASPFSHHPVPVRYYSYEDLPDLTSSIHSKGPSTKDRTARSPQQGAPNGNVLRKAASTRAFWKNL